MPEIKKIGIAFDPAPAKRGTDQAKKGAKELGSAYQAALQRIDEAAKKTGQSTQKLAQGVKRSSSEGGAAMKKMGADASRTQKTVGGAYDRMKAKVTSMTGKMVKDLQRASTAQKKAGSASKKMAEDVAKSGRKVETAAQKMKRGMQEVGQAGQGMAGRMGSVGRAAQGMTGIIQRAGLALRGLSRAMAALGRAAAAAGPAGLVALVVAIGAMVAAAKVAIPLMFKLAAAIVAVKVAAAALKVGLQVVKSGLGISGEVQRAVLSFQAMTGSLTEANRIMESLRANSRRTGGDLVGSANTVKRFVALGFSADDAIKLNKSILDVAGSIGMSREEAKLLGAALAQVQSKGVVSMEELRQQIAEKGVPVFDELARKMNVSKGALIDMVSKGEVESKKLIDIFLNLEGSFARFAGGAERMTKTLPGAIDRLKANWQDLKIELTTPLANELVPILNQASDWMERMRATARFIGEELAAGLRVAVEILKRGEGTKALMLGFRAAIEFLWNGVSSLWEVTKTLVKIKLIEAFAAAVTWWVDFMTRMVTAVIKFLGNVLTGNWRNSIKDSTDFFKLQGEKAADFLKIKLINALTAAFVRVVNAFKDGMVRVIEGVANALGDIAKTFNPARLAGKAADFVVPGFIDGNPTKGKGITRTDVEIKIKDFEIKPIPLPERPQLDENTKALNDLKEGINSVARMFGVDQLLDTGGGGEMNMMDAVLFGAAGRRKPGDAIDQLGDYMGEIRKAAGGPPAPQPDIPIPEMPPIPDGPSETEKKKAGGSKKKEKAFETGARPEPQTLSEIERLRLAWGDVDKQLEGIAVGSLQAINFGMTDALTGIINGTKDAKTAFTEMATSIISDITRMIIQMTIQLALQKAINAAMGGTNVVAAVPTVTASQSAAQGAQAFSSYNPQFVGQTIHQGGVVGSERNRSARLSLPRFHQGGVSSEGPVMLEKGETVLTRRQAADVEAELEASRNDGRRNFSKEQGAEGPTIINVMDRQEIADIVASNPDAVVNAISRRLPAVRKLVQGGQRI